MNIYLAGDSIVQNYTEEEFIAGWGQYLKYYVTPDTKVFNYAKEAEVQGYFSMKEDLIK